MSFSVSIVEESITIDVLSLTVVYSVVVDSVKVAGVKFVLSSSVEEETSEMILDVAIISYVGVESMTVVVPCELFLFVVVSVGDNEDPSFCVELLTVVRISSEDTPVCVDVKSSNVVISFTLFPAFVVETVDGAADISVFELVVNVETSSSFHVLLVVTTPVVTVGSWVDVKSYIVLASSVAVSVVSDVDIDGSSVSFELSIDVVVCVAIFDVYADD